MNDTITIEEAVKGYLEKLTELSDHYYAKVFSALTPPIFSSEWGTKYVRIVRTETFGSGRSVHTFIDRTNGNVLKAASWKAPAKHSRGNVFSEKNGMEYVDHYGAASLKRGK